MRFAILLYFVFYLYNQIVLMNIYYVAKRSDLQIIVGQNLHIVNISIH